MANKKSSKTNSTAKARKLRNAALKAWRTRRQNAKKKAR